MATHNFYIVLLSNGKFVFILHSLDLTLNSDYDYGGVQLFGSAVITRDCEANDECAEAFVTYLEEFNTDWETNLPVHLAELDEINTFLEGIDMIYSEDPADLRDLKQWMTDRPASISEAIELWRECGYGGGGFYWWDTGAFDPCAGYGDTGFRSDTGDTGMHGDTAGGDTADTSGG